MRTSLLLTLSLMAMACSAESAPDNAAGSVKKATQPDIKVQPEGIVPIDDTTAAEAAKKDPTVNGPRCNTVTKEICEDGMNQKFCTCTGPMKRGEVYECGCKAGTTSGGPSDPPEKLPVD